MSKQIAFQNTSGDTVASLPVGFSAAVRGVGGVRVVSPTGEITVKLSTSDPNGCLDAINQSVTQPAVGNGFDNGVVTLTPNMLPGLLAVTVAFS